MKLIIGGAYQGKLDYACKVTGIEKEGFADGSSCPYEAIENCQAMNGFHAYIRRMLMDKMEVDGLAEHILRTNPEIVLVTNEVGYGVVPIDPSERQYREACGRVCCELAGKAEEVHRVVCGMGTVLKP